MADPRSNVKQLSPLVRTQKRLTLGQPTDNPGSASETVTIVHCNVYRKEIDSWSTPGQPGYSKHNRIGIIETTQRIKKQLI